MFIHPSSLSSDDLQAPVACQHTYLKKILVLSSVQLTYCKNLLYCRHKKAKRYKANYKSLNHLEYTCVLKQHEMHMFAAGGETLIESVLLKIGHNSWG